jgi:hypothetical protein
MAPTAVTVAADAVTKENGDSEPEPEDEDDARYKAISDETRHERSTHRY